MTHPTLEDAARAIVDRHSKLPAVVADRLHRQYLDHNMSVARAVLLSIRPPDGFEVTLKEQMAREYIDAVLRRGE